MGTSNGYSCCCCCKSVNNKVTPAANLPPIDQQADYCGSVEEYVRVEVRPGRWINIRVRNVSSDDINSEWSMDDYREAWCDRGPISVACISSPHLIQNNVASKYESESSRRCHSYPSTPTRQHRSRPTSSRSYHTPHSTTDSHHLTDFIYTNMRTLSKMSHRIQVKELPGLESTGTSKNVLPSPCDQMPHEPSDIVIFFVHGVGGCCDVWHSQLVHLASLQYKVVAPDLLGHGTSSAPRVAEQYEFSELMTDMLSVFDRYCSQCNVLIGHSYGTSFTTVLARERQSVVSKLVLVSGGGPVPLSPQPGPFCLPPVMFACLKPLIQFVFNRGAFSVSKPCYSKSRRNSIRDAVSREVNKKLAFDIPSHVLYHVMNGQHWPGGDLAYHRQIRQPTLLIYGMKDRFVTLHEEHDMEKAIPTSVLECLPSGGHMIMMECSDEVNTLITSFLRSPTHQPSDDVMFDDHQPSPSTSNDSNH